MTAAGADPLDFERLFAERHRSVWRLLARLGGREAADELAGEVFTKALAAREGYDRARGSVDTWLYAIALNLLRDRGRRIERSRRALDRLASEAASAPPGIGAVDGVDDALTADRRLDAVRRAMDELADRDREILVLAAWEGLSYEAIAAVLDTEIGTVRSRLSRARARLRALVDGGVATREPS